MRPLLVSAPLLLAAACGAPPGASSDTAAPEPAATQGTPCTPPEDGSAPTYTELFERYFAPGTPGHCATAGCHASPGFNVWLCGTTKDSCYAGMVEVGLIDRKDPLASLIANSHQSPLSWVNPTGDMPFDAATPFPEGRDAVQAWVAACALDN